MIVQDSSPVRLHDLYEPPPVPFSFEAPGWYVLGGILLIGATLVTIIRIRRYIKNRYRRDALRELNNMDHAAEIFPQLFVVLKRTAIFAFGREKVAPLYGTAWLSFLEKTGVNVHLNEYRDEILPALYHGHAIDPVIQDKILSNAKIWIKTHAG